MRPTTGCSGRRFAAAEAERSVKRFQAYVTLTLSRSASSALLPGSGGSRKVWADVAHSATGLRPQATSRSVEK